MITISLEMERSTKTVLMVRKKWLSSRGKQREIETTTATIELGKKSEYTVVSEHSSPDGDGGYTLHTTGINTGAKEQLSFKRSVYGRTRDLNRSAEGSASFSAAKAGERNCLTRDR